MLFDNNDINLDLNFLNLAGLTNFEAMTLDNNNNVLDAKEGFLRGNMFKDEYLPYKNMTYINIRPKSDREAKLFNVMQYSFAINDLNLYLDLHPDDQKMLRLLEKMLKEEEKAKNEYIEMYGPLSINDTTGDKFKWIDNPWSWENLGGSLYV